MPSCVFLRCSNYTATVKDRRDKEEKRNISFHTLPRDELIREKWLKIIRTQRREYDWMPSKYSTVCSDHFVASDKYVTKKNVFKLKTTAVPILNKKDQMHQQLLVSSSKLESEESSIANTRREEYLKSTIKKITQHKHKLQSKNYNLTRKNKRLKEKCSNLKEIVLELQKKLLSYTGSEDEGAT